MAGGEDFTLQPCLTKLSVTDWDSLNQNPSQAQLLLNFQQSMEQPKNIALDKQGDKTSRAKTI